MSNYSYKQYGDELRFDFCPICNEVKSNPDFTINIKTCEYYCHSTGKGGNIKELDNFNFDLSKIEPTIEKPKKDLNSIVKASHPLSDGWLKYLKGRGIVLGKGIARTIRLGKFGSMMIPVTNGTEVVAVKYRTMDKKLSSEPGSQSDYFVNWQNIKDKSYLIIVEGEIDLLSAIESDFDNTVSLPFGCKNLRCIDNQKNWIKEFSKIIIAVDNDAPGKECQKEIIKKLNTISKKLYAVDMGEFKDFNDILVAKGIDGLKNVITKVEKIEITFEPFNKEDDGYQIYSKDGYTKLTDFTLEIKGYSDNYISGMVKTDGREREFKAKKTDLLTKNGMLEHLGYYLGSTQSIAKFWSWILSQNIEQYILEIDHYGIIDNKYYDSNSRVICCKEDLKIQNIKDIELLTSDEKEWLDKKLIYLRKDTNQSLLGICWALGRFHIDESYPILEVAGTTSIGKTEYVEFISRILFGSKENIKSFTTLTNHQIRSLSSCSNITPWVIDEVKITGKNLREKATDLYSTIRAVYDNKTINQGNTTNKLTEFKLCTPLIISGETELSDVSIKNRMISVELNKKNKSEDEVFFPLKNSKLLEKFGLVALNNRLNAGVIDIPLKKIKEKLPRVKDERQLYNGKCLLTGLEALKNIITLNKEIEDNFIKYLNVKLANEFNVISNFMELLEMVAESDADFNTFYKKTGNKNYIRFNALYKIIAEEHNKTNSTLELLDARTLKKQLVEEGFIIKQRVNVRFINAKFGDNEIITKGEEIILINIFDS